MKRPAKRPAKRSTRRCLGADMLRAADVRRVELPGGEVLTGSFKAYGSSKI